MCGAAIALVWSASSARADEWDKRTVLTVNQPIQVKDRLLEPGTYVFRLLDTKSDRHTVQIFNGDQSRIIDTVFAIPRYRLQPAGRSEFAFWETPPGTARALRAWFYPGDTIGLEFTYPKHPVVLTASLNIQTGPSVTPLPAEAAPAPEPTAQYEPETVEPPTQHRHAEVAEAAAPSPSEPAPEPQANPEPQPAAQETAPAPAPEPAALPKTASPFPPIGIAGFLAVSLYALLRWRRTM
jgi:hypothetical protein